jgi:hypothetical protein
MATITRGDLYSLIDELPETVFSEVARFLEFVRFKLKEESASPTPYVPVAMGGLWREISISDDDITNVRQEMWRNFGEAAE